MKPKTRPAEPLSKDAIHALDLARVDDIDEVNENGERLERVWCRTCGAFEWHWVERPPFTSKPPR